MKVNDLEVRISDFEGFKNAVRESFGRPPTGKLHLFLEPHKFHSIFTVERIRLLQAIRGHPDFGTVKLAQLLGRKQEAVSRDLSYLRAIGIISNEPAGHSEKGSAKHKPAAISVLV